MRARTQTHYAMTFDYSVHPEYKSLYAKRLDNFKTIDVNERLQSELLTKISDYDSLHELLDEQVLNTENVSNKYAKALLKTTGMDYEQWNWRFQRCKDTINHLRIDSCLEIASIQSRIDLLKLDTKIMMKELDACRDRLIKEHKDANDSTRNKKPAIASAA